jgi:hypothetical protein
MAALSACPPDFDFDSPSASNHAVDSPFGTEGHEEAPGAELVGAAGRTRMSATVGTGTPAVPDGT